MMGAEIDEQGTVLSGSSSLIFYASIYGSQVRVVVPTWGVQGYALEFDVAELFIRNNANICYQSLKHVDKQQWDRFPDNAAWRFLVVCLSGEYQEILYDINMASVKQTNRGRVAMQWFVRFYACPNPVYTSDEQGTIVAGRQDLIDAVLNGYDVKGTRVLNDYTLTSVVFNNREVNKNGDVAGQTVWKMTSNITGNVLDLIVPVSWHFTILSTTGRVDMSSWLVGQHKLVSRSNVSDVVFWFADSCWQHVYTNDVNGEEKEGSLEFLVAAVEAGHRVKILVGNYSIEPDSVRSAGGRLSAQLLDQVSKKDLQTFNDDVFWVWQMMHSSGAVRTRTYFVGSNVNNGNRVERKSIRWFIDTRTWTKVLSTNPSGEVEFGSKSELRAAIKKGANVRVAWRVCKRPVGRPTIRHRGHFHGIRGGSSYWYFTYSRFTRSCRGWLVMTADNVELGPNEEVAAQLLRTVSAESVSREQFDITERNPFWRFMTVSTQSNVDVSQWGVGDLINNGHFSEKAYVRWFVSY